MDGSGDRLKISYAHENLPQLLPFVEPGLGGPEGLANAESFLSKCSEAQYGHSCWSAIFPLVTNRSKFRPQFWQEYS